MTTKRDVAAEKMYPCADCGALRTKAQGGTTFTVCDDCWDRRHPTKPGEIEAANDTFKSGFDAGRNEAIEEVVKLCDEYIAHIKQDNKPPYYKWNTECHGALALFDKIKSLKEK